MLVCPMLVNVTEFPVPELRAALPATAAQPPNPEELKIGAQASTSTE